MAERYYRNPLFPLLNSFFPWFASYSAPQFCLEPVPRRYLFCSHFPPVLSSHPEFICFLGRSTCGDVPNQNILLLSISPLYSFETRFLCSPGSVWPQNLLASFVTHSSRSSLCPACFNPVSFDYFRVYFSTWAFPSSYPDLPSLMTSAVRSKSIIERHYTHA